jgi:hypothetical protein
MNEQSIELDATRKLVQKPTPIAIIEEDRHAAGATRCDVIDQAGTEDSKWSRHAR